MLLLGALAASGGRAWAGPPFLTDDPEPVALHHWELYGASQWSFGSGSSIGTLPHVEVNYGAAPELQLHVIAPAALATGGGSGTAYGIGDIELGAKFRFVAESDARPQIGTFPLVELPTGSAERGLGSGALEVLLPIWLQKSFDRWTTYGGGGVELDSAGASSVFLGWLLQRTVAEWLALGVEVYYAGESGVVEINLGAIVDLSEHHHVLVSAGPAFGGGARAQAYIAYQLTW